jgi:hypothetical protein
VSSFRIFLDVANLTPDAPEFPIACVGDALFFLQSRVVRSNVFTNFRVLNLKERDVMTDEQAGNARLEESQSECLNIEVEELELIIAPGNTWSV